MKILLSNFRKYKQMSFTMGTSIVKVTGESGSGKSTLLDSIYYVLYGKLQKVKPKDGSGTTEVVFEFPYNDSTITIRRRNRNDITVWIGEDTYEGDRAQGIIDDYFGTSDSFLMTSYLKAESMHKFISASPSEKKEITHLLFPDIRQYDKYCLLLKEKRKTEERLLEDRSKTRTILSSSVNTLEKNHVWLDSYNESDIEDIRAILDNHGIVYTDIPSHTDIQKMSSECSSILGRYETLMDDCVRPSTNIDGVSEKISEIRDKIHVSAPSYQDLQKKIGTASSILSRYNILKEQDVEPEYVDVDSIQSKIDGIESDIENRSKDIYDIWKLYSDTTPSLASVQKYTRECYTVLGRYDTLISQLIEKPSLDIDSISSRISDIQDEILSSKVSSETRESKLAYLRGSLESLHSIYDADCIRDYELTRKLHSLCPVYDTCIKDLADISTKIKEVEVLLLDYENSIAAMEYNTKLSDILVCPSCGSNLRHTDALYKVEEDVRPRTVVYHIDKKEVEQLKIVLATHRKTRSDIQARISSYDDLLSSNPHIIPLLSVHGSPAKYNRYISDMKNKKERIDSISSEIANVLNDNTRYLSQSEMDSLRKESEILESDLSRYHSDMSKWKEISSSIEVMKERYSWLERGRLYIEEIEEIGQKIQSLDNYMSSVESTKKDMVSKISSYSLSLSKYDTIHNQIVSLLESNPWLVSGEEYISKLESDLEECVQLQGEHERMKRELSDLESLLSSHNESLSRYTTVKSKVDSLIEKYPWLEKGSKHIEDLQSLATKIIDYNKRLEMRKIHATYLRYKEELKDVESQAQHHRDRIDSMTRLGALLNEAYRRYVDYKMKEIEYDISMLGKLFFDESMNITIISDKSDKPSFDLRVEHEGIVYDDIRCMSTGERKRLSIIMMIVLSKYLDAKIMMLDEAFSSIGMDSRGVVLNELGKLNIPLILTSHDDISGGCVEMLSLD